MCGHRWGLLEQVFMSQSGKRPGATGQRPPKKRTLPLVEGKSLKSDKIHEELREKRGAAGAEQNGNLQDPALNLESFRCRLLRLPRGQLLHAGRFEPSVLKDPR